MSTDQQRINQSLSCNTAGYFCCPLLSGRLRGLPGRALAALLLLLAACGPPLAAAPTPGATAVPTLAAAPAPSPTTPAPTPAPPAPDSGPDPQPEPRLCSPLQDVALAELPQMVSNPFHPPPAGSDDPHQGVDFADRLAGSQIALGGRPVHAVLDGQAAMTLAGRFPYGNAVLVETPLEALPEAWLAELQLPEPQPTLAPPQVALTCPQSGAAPAWEIERRSLYLLYAHLQDPPALQSGEAVGCGQPLGVIGDSGNALNPHLHLEARVGPAGARFASLAHYDAGASLEEMENYCTWRVSGLFQLVDPLRLLALQP